MSQIPFINFDLPYEVNEAWANLATVAENLQLHHENRDGAFIRPGDLRDLLRQICYLLYALSERSEGSNNGE